MKFNISQEDRSLSELLRISSYIISDICEKSFLKDATSIPLSDNQFYILRILNNTSPFNLSDLANILSVSNAAIGKNIDKLVQYKLVRRRYRKNDRRTANVSITSEGTKIVKKFNDLKLKKQVNIFKNFTIEEKKEFLVYLRKFISNTLHKDVDMEILCLQCDGACGDDCVVIEKNGPCIREHK